jgi:phosphatidylserine/phosphatidylglycerophosphate/cardiolipin synthase-like enzyme
VYRTRPGADGARPRNHAKFIAVDHASILVTSANFSASAETGNVELGLRVDDPDLVRGVERQMRAFEDHLYERVLPGGVRPRSAPPRRPHTTVPT